MTWRKSWAKNWDSVLYCSDRCRADKAKSRPASAQKCPQVKDSA
jgi:hypothetical protein